MHPTGQLARPNHTAVVEDVLVTRGEHPSPLGTIQQQVFDLVGVDAPVTGEQRVHGAGLARAGWTGRDDDRVSVQHAAVRRGPVLANGLGDHDVVGKKAYEDLGRDSERPSCGQEGRQFLVDTVTQ